MGSKNRIFLGSIIDYILHFHRNHFLKKPIYMSKRIQEKIKTKHRDVFKYTECEFFLSLQNNTIASSGYDKDKQTLNFIAYFKNENKYIMYSLKFQKNHTVCNTIYSLRRDSIKKHYEKEDFKLLKESYKKDLEKYITN